MVTEYNGHMFPTKKFDNESRRVEQALRHLNVLEDMRKEDKILGAIGWCMFDYNTHKEFGSGDKICYHGVMDMYRIPKDSAYVYGSQQDETPVMHISSSLNIGEYNGSILEDIYIFTNCDYIKLSKNGEFIKTFYPGKELYPNIIHAPIIVNDLIGDSIKNNEAFSENDSKIVKEILINVNKNGLNLSLINKLKMGWIFLKYKMNMNHAEDLYTKYFAGWGHASTDYIFKGFINDKCVAETTKSQVLIPSLLVTLDNNFLIEDKTYDTTRTIVKLVDQNNNNIIYANDSMSLETQGPIEIIAPKVISLIGGSIGFWIKSIGESGIGTIKVISHRFGISEHKVTVTKL